MSFINFQDLFKKEREDNKMDMNDIVLSEAASEAMAEVVYDMDAQVIADHYGWDAQSRQAQEEMAELSQALNKIWREGQQTEEGVFTAKKESTQAYVNLVEELADVRLLTDQLAYLLDCKSDVDKMKRAKASDASRKVMKEVADEEEE